MKWFIVFGVLSLCSVSHAQEVVAIDDACVVEPDIPRDATRAEIEQRCSEIQWELNALYWEYLLLSPQLEEAISRRDAWSVILRTLAKDPSSSEDGLIEALAEYNHWALEVIRISGRMARILNRTSSLLLEWTRLQERLGGM